MLRADKRGATDVFEEIPSLLLVIFSTFLFLLSLTSSLISYSERQAEAQLDQRIDHFCNSLLSYEPLLLRSKQGKFDSSKLNEHSRTKLEEHFDAKRLGFHFNITLVDVSLYETTYAWSAGENPTGASLIRTMSIPVVVSNEQGQHHSALLKIMVWA